MSNSSMKRAVEIADRHYEARQELKFEPSMTLIDAARLANRYGLELHVSLKNGSCLVEAVAGDYIPMFLRKQAT